MALVVRMKLPSNLAAPGTEPGFIFYGLRPERNSMEGTPMIVKAT